MMNYQEMSDFEINKNVSMAIYGRTHFTKGKNPEVLRGFTAFNPCNSWADAGSIAEKYKIAVAPYKKGDGYIWQAFGPGEENYAQIYDRNPCRAICIVFLMMKGGE